MDGVSSSSSVSSLVESSILGLTERDVESGDEVAIVNRNKVVSRGDEEVITEIEVNAMKKWDGSLESLSLVPS